MRFIILCIVILLLDLYVFQLVKLQVADHSLNTRRVVYIIYWFISAATLAAIPAISTLDPFKQRALRTFLMSFIGINFVSKFFVFLFLIIDDVWRGIQWVIARFSSPKEEEVDISRSKFLMTSAVVAGALPAATMGFGIVSGAYDYRVRRRTLTFPNLPKAFDGVKIAQLSDIHSGSFYNKKAVMGGVEMVMKRI